MSDRLSQSHLLHPLMLILVAYLLIAFGYGVTNPLFEAPDEYWHYFTTQHIADTGQLPFVADEYDEWLGQEAAQPPLYYLLGSLLIAPIDTSGAKDQIWLNSFAWIGNADALANVNRIVHTPLEAWPWHGYALAAHLLRGMSILFGLGTLLFVYASARLLWPSQSRNAYLATALTAFLPQFAFIHSTISNDALITFLSSAAIWQILRLWLTQVTWQRLLLLGMTIGLAALSKNAGILLLLFAIGTLLLLAVRDNRYQLLMVAAVCVILPVFLIAGWLWWRNWLLYGDFTAANQFIRVAGGDRDYSLLDVLSETDGLWLSFFAIFGWFNVRAPNWVYLIWNGGIILAIIGAFTALLNSKPHQSIAIDWSTLLHHKPRMSAILLVTWFMVVYAGLVMFMLRTEAAQGRLLFPAMIPIAMGLVYGLNQFQWHGIHWIASLLAFITTIYCLFFVLAPAYAQPAILSELPRGATPLEKDMGQGLKLIGSQIESEVVKPGDVVWFTLYWQAETVPVEPPEVVLELFGRYLTRVGNLHSYHGRGLFPANLWPQGNIVADRVGIRLDEEMDTPVLAWAQARLAREQPIVNVGRVKVVPAEPLEVSGMRLAQLGDEIELMALSLSHTTARPGDVIELNVTWHATTAPGKDFTTLIHLSEAGHPPLATGDSQPLGGEYPTRVWSAGEVIEDTYTVTIPPDLGSDRYPLWIGMYNSTSPEIRLPLLVNGERQANEVYLAGWLEIQN